MHDLAVEGGAQCLVPFVLGYETVSEAMSLSGGSAFRWLLEPVTAVAVVYDVGWILIDGGFDPRRVRDRELRASSFGYENYSPVVPAGDPLVDQVEASGLAWADLAALCLTHTHFDHTGGVRMLTPDQPLVLQRREYEYVCDVEDQRMAFVFRDDVVRDGVEPILLDGDARIAPGLRAMETFGHTPGHQSFVIDLPDETVVLAGDAADLRANIDRDRPCGSVVGDEGAAQAARSLARLRDLDAQPGVTVWPSHDPDWEPWRRAIDRAS